MGQEFLGAPPIRFGLKARKFNRASETKAFSMVVVINFRSLKLMGRRVVNPGFDSIM